MTARLNYFNLSLLLILSILSPLLSIEYPELLFREEDGLTFRYHQRDQQLIEQLHPLIIHDIEEFQRAIGFYPEIKGEIIIAPDREFYQNIIAGHKGIIEFSEALYSPSEKRIYIRNPRDLRSFSRLRRIILHEYIHLFLDSQFDNIPLWFHEGMAVFFSGDLNFERELLYARDFLLGNSLTLNEMAGRYPDGQIRWESFYAKSALAVKYLYSNHLDEFYNLWNYNDIPIDFSLAFFRAFKLTPGQFSPLLEDYLKKRFRIEILLAFTGIIWGVLPFILLLAWLRKRWVNNRIKKKWELPQEDKEAKN